MPLETWKGMIVSSMNLTQFSRWPGMVRYCRSSKNIEAPPSVLMSIPSHGSGLHGPAQIRPPRAAASPIWLAPTPYAHDHGLGGRPRRREGHAMRSRWSDADARDLSPLELLVYVSRL